MEPMNKLPKPDWQTADGRVVLYNRDCLDLLPLLERADAVIADPPYGIAYKPLRGSNGSKMWGSTTVLNDDRPFDPAPFLALGKPTILWGANHFSHLLPGSGGWLVWDKAADGVRDGFVYSHCELAWTNTMSRVQKFSLNWQGASRDGEGFHHPTQKSLRLMEWCIELVSGQFIADPFMGSGTTGVACVRLGRAFIGCELDPIHFETACRRIEAELNRAPLFEPAPIVQRSLIED